MSAYVVAAGLANFSIPLERAINEVNASERARQLREEANKAFDEKVNRFSELFDS